MQLKPEHHLHPTTHVLAALLKAAIEQHCHIWIAEHAVLLGQFSSVPAAYVLNGQVPTNNPAHPYQHHAEATGVYVDLADIQLCGALLMLHAQVGRLPPMQSSHFETVTVGMLGTILKREQVMNEIMPVAYFRQANNGDLSLLDAGRPEPAPVNAG